MKSAIALLVALAVSQTLAQQPAASVSDVSTPDALIKAVYDVISGPAGKKRDWNRMRSLFAEDARMIVVATRPSGEVIHRTMKVEDYIKQSGPFLEERGFFEREVARRTESFGNLVHAWSTYEARMKAEDEKPFMRGINSIQLVGDGKRWFVSTIFWQAEDAKLKLPDKYLKGSG